MPSSEYLGLIATYGLAMTGLVVGSWMLSLAGGVFARKFKFKERSVLILMICTLGLIHLGGFLIGLLGLGSQFLIGSPVFLISFFVTLFMSFAIYKARRRVEPPVATPSSAPEPP